MNILYTANDLYAPQLASSMCSVLYNNRSEEELDIYVFSTGLTEKSAESLQILCASYGRRLTVIDLTDISGRLGTGNKAFSRKFNASIFGRFFIDELLPKNIDKILYLDCDTTVTGPLKELYDVLPDRNYVIAAAMEPTIYKETREMLGMKPEDPYYNSGVLLIDMNMWRAEDGDKKLLDYYRSIEEASVFADQDAINGFLSGRIKTISPKYNFVTNYAYFRYSTLIKMAPWYKAVSEEEFKESVSSPVIIHYAGDERPGIRGNFNPYRGQYHRYLNMTEWKDTPETAGREGFMFMYHMMNETTRVCPPARRAASALYARKLFKK